MANTVDENLRLFLTSDSAIARLVGGRVHENHVPQQFVGDYVWFAFSGGESARTLGDAPTASLFSYRFDLECMARSIRQARVIAEAVFARLDSYRGTFGDTTVKGIFVDEQPDDYEPRGVLGDTGIHVASKLVEVIP